MHLDFYQPILSRSSRWLLALPVLLMSWALALPGVSAQSCTADAGTLAPAGVTFGRTTATLNATPQGDEVVPEGFEKIFVLTSGNELVIEKVNSQPEFVVVPQGTFTIHTLVYNPETLDLGIVEFGETTGFDVNALLQQGGGAICASLDVAGASFEFGGEEECLATAGSLAANNISCLDEEVSLSAFRTEKAEVPEGFALIYVLTKGEDLVIVGTNDEPEFTVDMPGRFTIHTLVYNPETLDLSIVEPGVTTGFDVNALLIQGGGDICGALDVAGAPFDVEKCCQAEAGTLTADAAGCLPPEGEVHISASVDQAPNIPEGFQRIFVLTQGEELVIVNTNDEPQFDVSMTGRFTIHTLVFNPATLDLSIVVPGQTTGFDVNALLQQGGGDICGALDVAGAPFDIEECCTATAGALTADSSPCVPEDGTADISASVAEEPNIPEGFQRIFVLTRGEDLVIVDTNEDPEFTVDMPGRFTIHTLVFDPATLDLGIVVPGQTTGFDVNALLQQGGGDICGALDVAGAPFDLQLCCDATAGSLEPNNISCLDDEVSLSAFRTEKPVLPEGYTLIYVLTKGEDLVIVGVNDEPEFTVDMPGRFTIHTLVYNPETLDLSIVEPGVTTGFDVNALLIQGGGDICGALDVAGAPFMVSECNADRGGASAYPNPANHMINIKIPRIQNRGKVRVEVYNAEGQQVVNREYAPGTTQARLDLSNFENGIYTSKIYVGGREWATKRFVKMK